jgi:serine/threonine protein kinase
MLTDVLCDGCQRELPEGAAHCPGCGHPAIDVAATLAAPARDPIATQPQDIDATAQTLTAIDSADAAQELDAAQASTLLAAGPGLPPTQAHEAIGATPATVASRSPERDDDSAADDPLIGRTIAERFRIERRLGAGGMGTVYVAEQTAVGRSVVLKFLHASLSRQPDLAERFSREALACSKLNAPNTIVLHDFGTADDGRLYMAMELLEGHTLAELVSSAGALPPLRAIAITLQVLTSLAEAHDKGIVHRDLKPENIMLVNRAGTVDFAKVLDFGIAKILVDDGPAVAPVEAAKQRAAKQAHSPRAIRTGPHRAETNPNLTQAGEIFGSPRYMAPEQALGEVVGPRTDIYAVGVILYELLCGRPPFGGENTLRLLHDHAHTPIKPLAQAFPQLGLPRELSELVARCLHKDPDERFGSAKELADALRSVSQVVVLQQQAEERALLELVGVKRRLSRGVIVGVLGAMLAVGALAYALLLGGSRGAKEGAPLAPGDRVFVAAAGPLPAWMRPDQARKDSSAVRVGRARGVGSRGEALALAEAAAVAQQLDVPLRFDPVREPKQFADDLKLVGEAYHKAKSSDRLREVGRYWVKLAKAHKGSSPQPVYDGYVALRVVESAVQRATLRKALADRRFKNSSFLLNDAVRRRQCAKAESFARRVRAAIDDLELPKARKATMRGYLEQVQLKPCAKSEPGRP